MKAIMLANDLIASGSANTVIGGGQESMSNAPFLLPKARGGYRLGHGEVVDHMFLDGLEDAYEPGRLMGTFAEDCAERYVFSREDQDDFAIESLTRAKEAIESGAFRMKLFQLPFRIGQASTLSIMTSNRLKETSKTYHASNQRFAKAVR